MNLIKACLALLVKTTESAHKVGKRASNLILPYLSEKIGDAKYKGMCSEVALNLCEHVGTGFVIKGLVKHAIKGKNPNMVRENVNIIERIMTEFGAQGFPLQEVIEFCTTAIGNTNPKIREAVITLLGTIYSYVGDAIKQFLKEVKPSTMKLIEEKFSKTNPAEEEDDKSKRKLRDEDGEGPVESGGDLLANLPR